jgi:uncharacterized spore protein YtfJ
MSTGLSGNLDVLFGKMENFISTKTVVGEPIHIGDVIIVPLVDVTFAVGAGIADSKDKKSEKDTDKDNSMGGGGLGGKITPTAVLVIIEGTVQLVSVKNEDSVKKLIDLVPGILSKLDLGSWFNKGKNAEKKSDKDVYEETVIIEDFDDIEESTE